MARIELNQVDIFYISYDEPNCEEHWAKLLEVAPWAKRVHGVKGFDAAHKACAQQSETDKFITVDGDNIIDPAFLDQVLDIPEKYDDCVLSWASVNAINGLVYGNGGLKLWPRKQTLEMQTHEAATDIKKALDFCWDDKYIQMNNVYSITYPNGSAFQAFRAGFREGVKMTIDEGSTIAANKIAETIHQKNLKRILIWMSVGMDVENGVWALYGSRLGLICANLDPTFDMTNIRDYDWFKKYWDEVIYPEYHPFGEFRFMRLYNEIASQGSQIRKATGMNLAFLDSDQSAFFKSVYEAPKRTNPMCTEIEADQGKF